MKLIIKKTLATKAGKLLVGAAPVAGQSFSFNNLAKVAFNTTSTSEALVSSGKVIIDSCLPPNIKYPIKCGTFLLQLVIAISMSSAPIGSFSWSLVIGTAKQILDAYLNDEI